jgi:ribosome-associated toxin RatA of RatAB toxin-antitoxin module
MAEIEKTVLVPYSAEKMFNLVDDVAKYPEFLPWCDGSTVIKQSENITHATVNINYHHVKHSFSTENKRNPPVLIEMTLLNGPFEHLDGHWRFIPLSDEGW